MAENNASDSIAQLLQRIQSGDPAARELLVAALYDELRRIAQAHLRAERPGHTLQPTALLHEAYMRVFAHHPDFADRAHFVATMALAMRRILVDYARSRNGAKRGGKQRVQLGHDEELSLEGADASELLMLDSALDSLAQEKEQVARFIEMHYFGGMTAAEIAEVTGVSVHMVRQRIRFGQAWLRRCMTDAPPAS
ncbi:MAG: ECF-type sigma factor [Bryobacteraceae bacterium]